MTADAAQQFFKCADKIQHKPLTDAQWADSVEYYQRVKVQTDALNELIKAHAEQTGKTTAQIRFAIKTRADAAKMRRATNCRVGLN